MKYLLLLIAIAAILFSCNPKPDDSTTTFGTSKQNKQHYENGKAVDDSVAFIQPTWGQAMHYANESGYGTQKILGAICLVSFGVIIVLLAVGKFQMGRGPGIAMLLCLCGFLGFYFGKPAQIKWNNDKEMPIDGFRNMVRMEGSTQVYWDYLYNQNLIIGAASK